MGVALVIQGLGIMGLEFQRGGKGIQGVLRLAQVDQGGAKEIPNIRGLGLLLQELLDQG